MRNTRFRFWITLLVLTSLVSTAWGLSSISRRKTYSSGEIFTAANYNADLDHWITAINLLNAKFPGETVTVTSGLMDTLAAATIGKIILKDPLVSQSSADSLLFHLANIDRANLDSLYVGSPAVVGFRVAFTAGVRVRGNYVALDTASFRDSTTFAPGSNTQFAAGATVRSVANFRADSTSVGSGPIVGFRVVQTAGIRARANLIDLDSLRVRDSLLVAGTAAFELLGSSSGAVRIKPAAAAGAWSLTLPTSGGTSGYPLTTDGNGVTSFSLLSAAGGGTNNAFFAVSGPASSTKTFTFPNASATVLTDNGTVTVAQGGTGASTLTTNGVLYGNGTSAIQATAQGGTNTVLVASGGAPSFSSSPTLTSLTLTGGLNASDGSPTNVAYVNAGGSFFVDGTGTTPTTGANGAMLIYDTDNSGGGLTIKLNENSSSLSGSDVFAVFSTNNATEGTIAGVSAGTIVYNTFTGGHYAQLENDAEVSALEFGMLVRATGALMKEDERGMEYLPVVTRTSNKNDPAVYGIWAGRIARGVSVDSLRIMLMQRDSLAVADSLRNAALRERQKGDVFSLDQAARLVQEAKRWRPAAPLKRGGTSADYAQGDPARDTHQIMALGTGRVLVTDEGGDVSVGDLLSSSSQAGLAMRQADDLIHSYTVGKATVGVRWDTVAALGSVKKKLIPCTYK